jgi:hypothetical protein
VKAFAEFHDSTVKSISRNGEEVVIEFPHVYLYLFDGEPFQQPGTGNSQVGRLVFSGVTSAEIPDLHPDDPDDEFDVWTGTIWVDGKEIRNVFEIPCSLRSQNILAEILFNTGQVFKVSCTGITYTGLNEPQFIERYRH